jgi:dethiobiotin synthetase
MAAEALGLPPFTVADLARETTAHLPAGALAFVETAGGARSPVAADGDCVALIAALAPAAVLLVADAGLGTINAVRLTVDALREHRVIVHLNRFDPHHDVHARNLDWLRTREGLDVVTDAEALATLLEPLAP